MKWTVSIRRTAKWGGTQKDFKGYIKNKEEKNRTYLIGWGHRVHFACGEKEEEISIEPRVGLLSGDWLTGYPAHLAKESLYRDEVIHVSV